MTNFHESEEFLGILCFLDAKTPALGDDMRFTAPVLANQIGEFGLPPTYADWYEPVTEVKLWNSAIGRTYECDGEVKTINKACIIGTNEFGDVVVDVDTGSVVDLDRSSGQSQLINTSFARFLYFVARMKKSFKCRCEDAASLFAEFARIDLVPMKNNDGIWSVTTFEAEEGMY